MSEPLILSVKEAARLIGVSERVAWRLIAEHRLRTVHPTPGRTGVTRREVEAYVASLERRTVA